MKKTQQQVNRWNTKKEDKITKFDMHVALIHAVETRNARIKYFRSKQCKNESENAIVE